MRKSDAYLLLQRTAFLGVFSLTFPRTLRFPYFSPKIRMREILIFETKCVFGREF